jgi:hypothetical protein
MEHTHLQQNSAIELDSYDLKSLRKQLKSLLGQTVRFSNGCYLSLVEDAGNFWGDDPYGQCWCCGAGEHATNAIAKWLEFWNEARDEKGHTRH